MSIRKIIHIDMDAFFASVELLDRPELRDQPVVISSHHPRAVIAAASYPARQFGLRSAMPMSQGRKLCPQVFIIEPNFEKYRAYSAKIHEIFRKYTDIIEPLSLDEAYLDVSHHSKQFPSATDVAHRIRQDIFEQTGLTASAGVAPNKFLAKIASDWRKPNGLFVIKPSQVQSFIQDLPLKKIPGVGKVTHEKLRLMQLETLGDLQRVDESVLIHHFGKYGKQLFLYAQGIDDRPVSVERERQQISKEITFDRDLSLEESLNFIPALIDKVWGTLQKKQRCARGATLKLKLNTFQTIQHSRSYKRPFQTQHEFIQSIQQLIREIDVDQNSRFRLIGVGLYQLDIQDEIIQLGLWNTI